jgi:hypothetical protein
MIEKDEIEQGHVDRSRQRDRLELERCDAIGCRPRSNSEIDSQIFILPHKHKLGDDSGWFDGAVPEWERQYR